MSQRLRRTRLRSIKRTISLRGKFEDRGKYYRCWNCGFINDSNRRGLGDGSGIRLIEDTETAYNSFSDGESIMDSPFMLGVVAHQLSDGSVDTGRTNFNAEAVSGCSLCGSKNYR